MKPGEQPNLRPASECIWYVLATIAGEPGKTPDPDATRHRNRDYWNHYMGSRTIRGPGMPRGATPEELETIRNTFEARGFSVEQIPDPRDHVDFSHLDFPNGTCFERFVFPEYTTFEGARFGGPYQNFSRARFEKVVSFKETRFDGQSHEFDGATFRGEVLFESAEFSGFFSGLGMTVSGALHFNGAKFLRWAWFNDSIFHGVTSFNGVEFHRDATFDRCKFDRDARFMDTEFRDTAAFNSAIFSGAALFQRAKFRGGVPRFFEAKLPEYTEWHGAQWPDTPKGTDAVLYHIHAYQNLARMMNQLEKFDDQRMFVREEMRVRRWIDGRLPAGLMNLAYALICDYGYGLRRVVVLWLVHMIVGAVVLFVSKTFGSTQDETPVRTTLDLLYDMLFALVLSFGHAHGPLGLNRTFFEDALKEFHGYGAVGPVQTVLGVIILFFLLLTIRNRFRMR